MLQLLPPAVVAPVAVVVALVAVLFSRVPFPQVSDHVLHVFLPILNQAWA